MVVGKPELINVDDSVVGDLTATVQPIQNENGELIIKGSVVPDDGSTGKVFFLFTFRDDSDYSCELKDSKGVRAYKDLTGDDDATRAQLENDIKEAIYDAKHADCNAMLSPSRLRTPASLSRKVSRVAPTTTGARRLSGDVATKSRRETSLALVRSGSAGKTKRQPKITEAGKLGMEISGLSLQIRGLKKRKLRAVNQKDEYDSQAKEYETYLQVYANVNKKEAPKIKNMLAMADEIANMREYWSGTTHSIKGVEHSVLHDFASLLRTTARYIDSKNLDADAIEEELKNKIAVFHDKRRKQTDLLLTEQLDGEDFDINDLEGVEMWQP